MLKKEQLVAGYLSQLKRELDTPKFSDEFTGCHTFLVAEMIMCEFMFGFDGAVIQLKKGEKVARKGWNGKSMWIALGDGSAALEAEKFWNPHSRAHAEKMGGTAEVSPYIIFKTADDKIQMGWQPSQADVLANDWVIAE